MTAAQAAEKVADSVILRLVARAAMVATPIVLAALCWLSIQYLEGRFGEQKAATQVVSVRVDQLSDTVDKATGAASALAARVIILETNSVRGRADREAFQEQITGDIKEMRNALVTLSNNVAALTATVQGLKERQAFNRPPN